MPASPRTELLSMIDEAFDGRAWHGPTLRRAVAGVTPAQAAWRPAPGRHSILEVALHAAYWKHEVRRRITGGPRGDFPIEGRNWFAADGQSWPDTVRFLEQSTFGPTVPLIAHVQGESGERGVEDEL